MVGETRTGPRDPPSRIQDIEEGGDPHTAARASCVHPGDGGDAPIRQRDLPERSQDMEEGGGTPYQQRTLFAHGMQEMEGGDPLTKRGKGGQPQSSNARSSRKAFRRRG